MNKEEITSYYDANIKSKLVEIVKDELNSLEKDNVNDVEELYFLERNGAFSDYAHWRKCLKTDNDFIVFVKRFPNFYSESKSKLPPEDSNVIHFNLKWNDFISEKHIEHKVYDKKLSYFAQLNNEFQSEVDRDSVILDRVDELKNEQKWDLKLDENSPQFAKIYEPKIKIKTHRDFLLDEVVWLATDFHMEKRWKTNVAKKLTLSCKRVQREKVNLRNQSLQDELLAKKHCKCVSKLLLDFWSNINKIKLIKIKKYIEYEKQQELNERLKSFVDKTQQYSSDIANKLTNNKLIASSISSLSNNDISTNDEFNIYEDSDQLERDERAMQEFIDDENLLNDGTLDEELNNLNNDCEMSMDDLINNLPPEYLEEYRRKTANYDSEKDVLLNDYNNRDITLINNISPSVTSINEDTSSVNTDITSVNEDINTDGGEDMNVEMMVENASRYKPTGTTVSTANCQIEQSFLLHGALREYQLVGLNWLMSLHDNNLNGILADEMGLGKTIQTIALIAHLAGTVGEWGPHLIIVPASVILNWECEFKKWCPSLKVLAYYGRTKDRKAKRHGWSKENAFHICITSFQLAIQDNIVFKKRRWYYLIIDEAHNIRNSKSVRWNMLLGLNTQRRLLLTGTPLQNNLMELWSLLHFLMPQLFQCEDAFRQWFAQPISSMVFNESSVDENTITKLHQILRPFILRRLKCEVELQIPKKYEHVIRCELSQRQRVLYNEYMMLDSTKSVLQAGNFMSIMQILIQLRKVCNHPDLFEPRPVISPFVCHPPNFHKYEIASAVDFSESHYSFLDEKRLSLLKKHPLLIINPKLFNTRPKIKSRKRTADEIASPLKTNDAVSTSPTIIVAPIRSSFKSRNRDYSVNHYVKKFSHFIDEYIEHIKQSSVPELANIKVNVCINGDTEHTQLTNNNLYNNVKLPKVCDCVYACDGCGHNQLKDTLSVPILRSLIDSQFLVDDSSIIDNRQSLGGDNLIDNQLNDNKLNDNKLIDNQLNDNKLIDNQLNNNNQLNNIHDFTKLLKKQALTNITRILEFSKMQNLNYNVELSSLDASCVHFNAPPNISSDNQTNCVNSLLNVSKDYLEQYIPYAIREILISATRTIAFTFELVKYSHTYSIKSTDKFLKQLCQSLNNYNNHHSQNYLNFGNNDYNVMEDLWKIYINRQMTLPQTRLIQYDCGKLQFLDDFLKRLHQEGHRVLIFTQMSKMLDILEKFLSFHHLSYLRLDGSTKIEHRQYMMELFNSDDSIFAFILSTRAGGLGLNLTGADTVIFYDNDWNPTVDAQAQDRCHRIGQIRDVHIYRLVCRNTVEENILKRAQQKRMLADVAIEGGNFTVSHLEQNFVEEIFGDNIAQSDPALCELDVDVDTSKFENVLTHAEKNEGIDEIDILASSAKTMSKPSAYDDFCDEIFSMENDMLPVERLALYYLESLLTEELTRDNVANNEKLIDNSTVIDQNGQLNGSNQFPISSFNSHINYPSIDGKSEQYFKPAVEPIEDNDDIATHDAVKNDENIQFGTFLMEDIKKMSSDDSSQWLPRGTNCFSILNDVYNLDPKHFSDALTTAPKLLTNSLSQSNTSQSNSISSSTTSPLNINKSIHNISKTTTTDNLAAINNVELEDEEYNENYFDNLSKQLMDHFVRSYFSACDASTQTAVISKLKFQDVAWLLHPNFYDQSITDSEVDVEFSALDNFNSNYYYADYPSINKNNENNGNNENNENNENNNIDDDVTTELFFSYDSLSITPKYLNIYPQIADQSFGTMLGLMTQSPDSIKSKNTTSCCYSDIGHLRRVKNCTHREKCFGTFRIVCPNRILTKLYAVMVDVTEQASDPINWEFFRYVFLALSHVPYPISHRHFHSWSVSPPTNYKNIHTNDNTNDNTNNKTNSLHNKTNNINKTSAKFDKVLNYIANMHNKTFVRVKNLKHQRIYKDLNNTSLMPVAALSKYSRFGPSTSNKKNDKETQTFNNKRNTLQRIHERIKKKHRLMSASTDHAHSSTIGSSSYTTQNNNQRRIIDQNKLNNEKLRAKTNNTQQKLLPCLVSSVRKRRTLLESNVMMYNQDKIAKVKQHVSRIAINDHLMLYRDVGAKAIRHVKFVDGKFVKISPAAIPSMPSVTPAVSNIPTKITTSNNPSRIIRPNVKSYVNPISTIVSNTVGARSQLSNSTNQAQYSNYNNQSNYNNYSNQNTLNRGVNYQRLNMPKTSAISSSNNSNIKPTSTMPTNASTNTASSSTYNFNQAPASNSTTAPFTTMHNPNLNNKSSAINNTTSSSSTARTSLINTTNFNNILNSNSSSNTNNRKGMTAINYKSNTTSTVDSYNKVAPQSGVVSGILQTPSMSGVLQTPLASGTTMSGVLQTPSASGTAVGGVLQTSSGSGTTMSGVLQTPSVTGTTGTVLRIAPMGGNVSVVLQNAPASGNANIGNSVSTSGVLQTAPVSGTSMNAGGVSHTVPVSESANFGTPMSGSVSGVLQSASMSGGAISGSDMLQPASMRGNSMSGNNTIGGMVRGVVKPQLSNTIPNTISTTPNTIANSLANININNTSTNNYNNNVTAGNTSRINQSNNMGNKLSNLPAIISPQKIINNNNNISNLQRTIMLQQHYTPTKNDNNVTNDVNNQINVVQLVNQHQQFNNLQKQQQYQLSAQKQAAFLQAQQRSTCGIGANMNSPMKPNYNPSMSSSSLNAPNNYGFVDTSPIDPINSNTNMNNSISTNVNRGGVSQMSNMPQQPTLYNLTHNHHQITGMATGNSNPNNVTSTSVMNNNQLQNFNNRQTMSNLTQSSNIQQQYQQQQQRNIISTAQQHIIHRLTGLQQQFSEVHRQPNCTPRMVQHLQQQNLLLQQQFQQQLLQLQQQSQLLLQHPQNDSSNNTPQSTNVGFDGKSSKMSLFNHSNPNLSNNILMRQLQSNQQIGNVGNMGANVSGNVGTMGTHVNVGGNMSGNMGGGTSSALDAPNNRMDKSQPDALTILNEIINIGGNVPVLLQDMLRGNSRGNPEQNITPNNSNLMPGTASSRGMIPGNNNAINIDALRHLVHQTGNAAQQGINTPRVQTATGGMMYPNTPITQPANNMPVNVNHPSFNDIHGAPSTYSIQDTNAIRNIPRAELYNLVMESKANNQPINYSAIQQLLAMSNSNTSNQPGGNNRGGGGGGGYNPGGQNNNR